MSDIARRLDQCRKPHGDVGKIVAEDMNEKHYELTSWGLEKLAIGENSVILDIGCGGGRTVKRLADKALQGKVYGIDYSSDCVRWSTEFNEEYIKKGKVEITKASVEKLPFNDDKFDFVTAVETVYFWPDFLNNIQEVKRVLKLGGKFAVINEMYKSDEFKARNEEFSAIGNMNIFSLEEIKNIFVKAGYIDIKIDTVSDKNWLCIVGSKPFVEK